MVYRQDPRDHLHVHHHHHPHGAIGGDEPLRRELQAPIVRRVLAGTVVALVVAAAVGMAVWWPRGDPAVNEADLGFAERVDATVTAAEVGACSFDAGTQCNTVTARITGGPAEGQVAALESDLESGTAVSGLEVGDDIVLNDAGPDVEAAARYSFADVQRSLPLMILALVFGAAVVALGRLRGLLALAGIGVTAGVLLGFVFPALLRGAPPVGVAITGAIVIAVATIYLAHGISNRTTVALLGTMASLAVTAGFAAAFGAAAQLSGLASDEAINLLAFAPDLDFRGLLLAATIIGTLGVLDDVTVTQVSAVWELRRSNPEASSRSLYAAGIRIGRDHIASVVNTLVLAYTAAALPTLLLLTQSGLGLGGALTTETLAVEIVQTLVGSIGLVAAVPVTTAMASWVVTLSGRDDRADRPQPLRRHQRRRLADRPLDPNDVFWGQR